MHLVPPDPFGSWLARGWGMALLVGMGMIFGGCTVTSFLGSQYTNFTAYYNTFYNAEKAFEKGVGRGRNTDPPIDRTQYLSVFREPTNNVDDASLEKAIQKSADLLREHPNSKWVDDALLLIGKSYFYQQNYVGGTEKFREVISLDGGRTGEARFWLARTLLDVERYEEAVEVIRTGVQEQGDSPWTARLFLIEGKIHTKQEQWQEAVQDLNRGLQGDLPDRLAARGGFLLGQVLETLDNPAAARVAYRQVQDHGPSYELGLAARLSEIELQGQHEDPTRALARLADLEDDEKNYEQRGEMALVRARIYRAQGQYDRAQQALADMLYGDDAPSGTVEGRLHYDLARLYRDAYEDFSRAAAHFDTASTALSRGQRGDGQHGQRLPAAPQNVDVEAERYRDLASRAREVARMDSLLRIGRMSDPDFQRFVENLRRQRQSAREEQEPDRDAQQSRRLRRGSGRVVEQRRGASPASNTGQSDAGFLFHKDPARVQQGKRRFEQTWGDRPLVDNWRRRNAIQNARTASAGTDEEPRAPERRGGRRGVEEGPQGAAGDGSALDLSAIPRDSVSQAKMEAERAVTRYELANSLFLAAGRPDSAATWYRRILQENGDHPVARRALYALAEVYRAQGDTTAARQTYRRLVDQYPDTDLSVRARERLGRQQRMSSDNPSVLADSAYTRAYRQWRNGRARAAFPALLGVARQYPETDAAPRALLAAGLIYWREVKQDSMTSLRPVLARHVHPLLRSDSTTSAPNLLSPDSTVVSSDVDISDSGRVAVSTREKPVRTPAPDSSRGAGGVRSDSIETMTVGRPEGPERPVRSDSLGSPADSVSGVEQLVLNSSRWVAAADHAESDPYAPLDSLLTYLTDRYPDAPQTERAQTILDLIEERRADASRTPADTTTREPPAADTAGAEQQTAARRQVKSDQDRSDQRRDQAQPDTSTDADETGNEAERGERDPLPAPTGVTDQADEKERDQETIDRSKGGWTLLVNSFATAEEASRYVEAVRERIDRWPVDVVEETQEGKTQHHLVVGQFESRVAAAEAQQPVGRTLSAEPTVRKIP